MFHLEGRQEPVLDAFLQGVGVNRLPEIGVGIDVVFPFRSGGQTELHGGGKVVEDAAPCAFVVGTPAMAFVDYDEIEEIRRIIAVVFRRVAVLVLAGHEGLEDGEEHAAIFRHASLPADDVGIDANQRVFLERCERVVRLIGQNVTVG